METQKFFLLALGFFVGIIWCSFYNWGWSLAAFFIFLASVMLFTGITLKDKGLLISLSFFLLGLGFGYLRYQFVLKSDFNGMEKLVDQKVLLEGVVFNDPEEKENHQEIVFKTDFNGKPYKILVYANLYPQYKYGDRLRINGALKRPENFSGFDWQAYLSKDDIYYEIFYPKIDFVSSGNGSRLKEYLFELKRNFLSSILRVVPEPNASFLGGVTIGAKTSIPQKLQDDFKKTGVVHIVVLSGYNITIVAKSIMSITSFLPMAFGFILSILGIILFAIMTGGAAATVRASIMAILAMTAKFFGRIYIVSWALLLAGFFMVFINPKILRFDSSFQLSFLATMGLIYLSPLLEEKFQSLPKKFGLKETLVSTLSAQIMVLPLLLYKTGLFSLYSLLTNILILSFMPLTMFLGFLTGILGMISSFLAIPFGWLSYLITQYELGVVNFFANLPASSFTISNFPAFLTIVLYFILIIFIFEFFPKNQN